MKNFKPKTPFHFILLILGIFSVLFFYTNHRSTEAYLKNRQIFLDQLPKGFEPRNLSWSLATGTAAWQPRDSAASFIFANKMWTIGGLNGNQDVKGDNNINYWEAPHLNDIWSTSDGITWDLMSSEAEFPVKRSMGVVLFQDKLWMFGGWSPVSGYTNDIWQSENGINWTKVVLNAPWAAREGHGALVFQDKMWLIGGVNYDQRETFNDVWYSSNGIDWTEATTSIPWSTRWDHGITIFNDKFYLSGGMNLTGQTFKDLWASADGLNWNLVTDNPPWQERQGHSLVVFKKKLWSIGRLNDTESGGANDVWYSEDGVKWQKTKTDPLWLGREDHSVLVFRGKMVVFGGMDSTWHWKNDVWFSSN